MNSANINIVWIRNDLRIEDNPALFYASKSGRVLPVYIWAPHEEDKIPGSASKVWLHYALKSFEKDLIDIGLKLTYRIGSSVDILCELINRTKAKGLYWNHRYEPKIYKRDIFIKSKLSNLLEVNCFNGNYFIDPKYIKNKSDKPFKVFTHFWKKCLSEIDKNGVVQSPQNPLGVIGDTNLSELEDLELLENTEWEKKIVKDWKINEDSANSNLNEYIQKAHNNYEINRNIPSINGTSSLSPFLKFGQISPNKILNLLRNQYPQTWKNSQFLAEIGWREFACHLLFHYPETINKPLRDEFRRFPWQNNDSAYNRWVKGLTGFPFVDSGMRQLWQTGWMHNRVRMVVASFLIKHLLIDWRKGADWFWDTLFDADLASNTLGWQWVAGCGADAAPYYRVFNPILQSKKFDTDGIYIRKWVKELSHIRDASIHLPDISGNMFNSSFSYPEPIVSHGEARIRALEAYQSIKRA